MARLAAELDAAGVEDEGDLGIGDEPESADLLERDPKEWKVSLLHGALFSVEVG